MPLHTCIEFEKNSCRVCLHYCFFGDKNWLLRTLLTCTIILWLLIFFYLPSHCLESRKRYTLRLLLISKKWSTTAGLLCKRIQAYWQSLQHGWLVIDVNFMQNKVGTIWCWYWFTSFCGWKIGMANIEIWCKWLLTSFCSHWNLAYHLHNACIVHLPLNTI